MTYKTRKHIWPMALDVAGRVRRAGRGGGVVGDGATDVPGAWLR